MKCSSYDIFTMCNRALVSDQFFKQTFSVIRRGAVGRVKEEIVACHYRVFRAVIEVGWEWVGVFAQINCWSGS